jgi:hypothetical protein
LAAAFFKDEPKTRRLQRRSIYRIKMGMVQTSVCCNGSTFVYPWTWKESAFLATVLCEENYSFFRIKDWNKVSRRFTEIPVKDNPDSIIISTLSSIDDYGLVYEQLEQSGWTMHKDILRWC